LQKFKFIEFFAGGGMARAGLGFRWDCVLANDFDPKKGKAYVENWGHEHFYLGDVWQLPEEKLRSAEGADLAWASFPCQDLSLAGNQTGLDGQRSGAFWGFWKQISTMRKSSQHPKLIVLENVYGALSANGGRDFSAILNTLRDGGYKAGALIIDAVHFVPQSRPRLFILAVREEFMLPPRLILSEPLPFWTPVGLATQLRELDFTTRKDWISWRVPFPPTRRQGFADLIDDEPTGGVLWHSASETEALLKMMSPVNLGKIRAAQLAGRKVVGTLYKRTRVHDGERSQRAEVRFDDIAGCLRTPGGGSSRQTLVVVEGKTVRTRLISPREAARLMGLAEEYKLPANYNDAYKLAGDGVVVPVVRHLAEYILEPLLAAQCGELFRVA
jgi:DNA (cytosine-5)-methyltransferase 1